jgi:hypothetical protein
MADDTTTGADAADDDVIASPVGREVGPDDDDGPPQAEQTAATVGRRPRKPLNKALFAKAAAAARAHVEGADDGEDELLPTGPGALASQVVDTAAAAKGEPAKPASSAPSAPAGPPPEAIAAWERVNLRAAELEKREAALKEHEGRARDLASRLSADPLAAMRDAVRLELGDDATDDEIHEELGYLITSLSLGFAGATVDPNNQAHDLKKLKRELRQQKARTRK